MIICGLKVTHDAAVALIDNGKLVFSIEIEKLANAARHSPIDDLSVAFDLLRQYGYSPQQVDHFVIDGWRNPRAKRSFFGVNLEIPVAPYRRGILNDDLLLEYQFKTLDFPYLSYSHYAGHVIGGYCTSPFAQDCEDAVVLAWDGAMFPFLYHIKAGSGRVEKIGVPFLLLGGAYRTIAQKFQPFDQPVEFPATLALPGKIMAYTGCGEVDEGIVSAFATYYEESVDEATGGAVPRADVEFNEALGRRILECLADRAARIEGNHADILASWQLFLERLLVNSVGRLLATLPTKPNFCFVGGCALNIKWNGALRASGLFSDVWVPPFPNDAGGAIGAACCDGGTRKAPGARLERL